MQLYLQKPLANATVRDRTARPAFPDGNGPNPPPDRERGRARVFAARVLAASALRLDRETARRAVA